MFYLVLFLLCLIQNTVGVLGYCYTRNGTTITSKAYQPCNNSTKASACCGTNHQGAGDTAVVDDVCMDNGLCQNYEAFDGTNTGQQLWWRQGCTDPTWQSPYCLANVCNGTEYAFDNAPVRNCGGNSWCCGEESCCRTVGNLFQLAATIGPTSSTSLATSVSSTPTVASSTSADTPTTTSDRTEDTTSGGLSIGVKVGMGVGIAVVVLLVIAIVVMWFKLRKSKSWRHNQINTPTAHAAIPVGTHEQKHQSQIHVHKGGIYEPVELEPGRHPVELRASNEPQELDVWDRVPKRSV